eukprot:TRINITY_DN1570_c0_g1_i3.p1 TRINITY_DN1570_c0_g1~~TRINITY_DN1570_c0_g1_i3.p1  ORF type:complete len:442 (+),score=76.36 TRINITY_DN1570_c0_g1_i3:59-1384(+)
MKSAVSENPLNNSLKLRCGLVLPNRIAKAALTENLADPATNAPNNRHLLLYEEWGRSGAGLLISGNVLVDRKYLESPGNVVLEDERDFDIFSSIAKRSQQAGALMFLQINHAGRQCPKSVTGLFGYPVAPSDLPPVGVLLPLFNSARALTVPEIHDIVRRFGIAASVAKKAGFAGVQIHSAHGYLSSQFLSKSWNRRTDAYGGTPENRRRFLLEVYREIRRVVGPNFAISVKMNSSDFQKGGLSEEESLDVIRMLDSEGVDLLESSGGSYESAAFVNYSKPSTRQREAYFLDFAKQVRAAVPNLPVMLTGGFRSKKVMRQVVLDHEVDVIGLGRPFCLYHHLIHRLLDDSDENIRFEDAKLSLWLRDISVGVENFWHQNQIRRIAEGKRPDLNMNRLESLVWSPVKAYVFSHRRNPQQALAILFCVIGITLAILNLYFDRN